MSEGHTSKRLILGALGVVFGDIGTSPLYTLKECFSPNHGVPPEPANVLGILSLIFWAMLLVVTLKYVMFVMRADNEGEGGVLALLALVRGRARRPRSRRILMIIGMFGAALFYGDGIITPAISVLSAVEGLQVAAPQLAHWVVPVSLVVLVSLFMVQSRGTDRVGRLFGPVMVLWFLVLGTLGAIQLAGSPSVLDALNPMYGIRLCITEGTLAFVVMGSVVLALTGAEALYADMGHFGRGPIRWAWYGLVLPALLLNYFGQGAHVLTHPQDADQLFYAIVPELLVYPMIALSTLATVIASQAVISGVFSITQQAMQLDLLPRMPVRQTSLAERGQIYVPHANWALMAAVVVLVVGFGSSDALAGAYGIAVTGTMLVTDFLLFYAATRIWGWSPVWAGLMCLVLAFVDGCFFTSNLLKIPAGGWFPLLIGAVLMMVMTTWRRGRELLNARMHEGDIGVHTFIERLPTSSIRRVSGTIVFLTHSGDTIPQPLLHNLKHNRVLHEEVVLLTVAPIDVPRVHEAERIETEELGMGFRRVRIRYGFAEQVDLPPILGPLGIDVDTSSFCLGRETVLPSSNPKMAPWRTELFALMRRNAASPTDFFGIPPNRVLELGAQVEI